MTALALARVTVPNPFRHETFYAWTGAVLLALALPIAVLMQLDARVIDGVGVWAKPLKFHLALALYALTLAFMARWVPPATLASRRWRVFTGVVIACIALEIVWIGTAAALGLRSHYNATQLPLVVVYPLMGVLATILTAATAQYAWAIHRNPVTGLSPAGKGGLVWGLGLTLPLTLLTAFTLSAGTGHHFEPGGVLGTGGSDAGGAPLFGWSRGHGDGRVPHFLATHAMHAVPLVALAFAGLGLHGAWAGRTAAALWSAAVLGAFAATLAGRSLVGWL